MAAKVRSTPNGKPVRRKESSSPKKPATRGQYDSGAPAVMPVTPTRSPRSGKAIPGHSPEGFGQPRFGPSDEETNESEHDGQGESDFDDDDDSVYEDVDDNDSIEVKTEGEDDDEFTDTVRSSAKKSGAKKTAASAKPAQKLVYKKGLRKDSTRFTPTQAMLDADEAIDPRVAAFRGKKIFGGGNGRQRGRKLVRWTPATDQLLLLCINHEFQLNKLDLPFDAIAERMFPEKNATGGAIKERFAKLRTELLNRGSWVPPVVGKSPQGSRPDVRGIVRVAPGVDKGRYVLWKEDASNLIDPKDINRVYHKAQAKGLEYPEREWTSNDSKKEFMSKLSQHNALKLGPFKAASFKEDEDVSDSPEEENESDVESEEMADPKSAMKRKRSVPGTTPRKRTNSTRKDNSDDASAGESEVKAARSKGSVRSRSGKERAPKITASPFMPKVELKYEEGTGVESERNEDPFMDNASSGKSDDDEYSIVDRGEVGELPRNIVVAKGLSRDALCAYPVGIQGPGHDGYTEGEVTEVGDSVAHDDSGDRGIPYRDLQFRSEISSVKYQFASAQAQNLATLGRTQEDTEDYSSEVHQQPTPFGTPIKLEDAMKDSMRAEPQPQFQQCVNLASLEAPGFQEFKGTEYDLTRSHGDAFMGSGSSQSDAVGYDPNSGMNEMAATDWNADGFNAQFNEYLNIPDSPAMNFGYFNEPEYLQVVSTDR